MMLGIKHIPESVADKNAVERDNDDDDAWDQHLFRMLEHDAFGLIQHGSPLRRGRLYTQTELGHGGDHKDHAAYRGDGYDDDLRKSRGKDVLENHMYI